MTMQKGELAKVVASKIGLQEKQVMTVQEVTFAEIAAEVKANGEVRIGDFGTFKRVRQEARKARNPQTGAAVDVPAKNKMTFKAASSVAAAIAG